MNEPEYIIVDEIGSVVSAVKTALSLPVLNYQYGYVRELKETLDQYSLTAEYDAKKFPLIWLVQPFSILRGTLGWYGSVDNMQIFIIQGSAKTLKAPERMTQTFKPSIYPIYRQLLKQLVLSTAFDQVDVDTLSHRVTDRYYWGDDQQKVINDVFDCMEISQLKIKISNNSNCKLIKSF